ncbi:hypothetical protein KFE25_007969 [Diacronema lutheri]|uniref:RNA helicase n=1 Tax=Diacronema lutheri TaxID=2081491 RepID=A0A8J5XRI0_DIALT|nr:hypothetical protein KFE25_007969 [Diacronema lutheri]
MTVDEPDPKRSRHAPHAAAPAGAEEGAIALRRRLGVSVRGERCPPPVSALAELALPDAVADALARRGLVAPTPIQAQAWPAALGGRDVVGIAQTGSGKTLAYVVPAVVRILAQPVAHGADASAGPVVVALAPTRELAAQIADEVSRLEPTVSVCCVQGGVNRSEQVLQLRLGAEFVVATPGRLADLLGRNKVSLTARCELLVLDEADRLLEMGFEAQLRTIVGATRRGRQTLMWSATWSAAVSFLAAELLSSPLHIEACAPPLQPPPPAARALGAAEGGKAAAEGGADSHAPARARAPPPVPLTIRQRVVAVESASAKLGALVRMIEDEVLDDAPADLLGEAGAAALGHDAAAGAPYERACRVLIFVNSKRRADELTTALRADGWPALGLHGDKPQLEREWALGEFRAARAPLLVATDVAQRGLDIQNVGAVINFDAPPSLDAYVHRVGRTGRAGARGSAHTLWVADEPAERAIARELSALLAACGQPPLPSAKPTAPSASGAGDGHGLA